MFLNFFYEISLWLLACAAIPKMLYQRLRYGKYRNSFSKRFGFGFPNIVKGKRSVIWVHAVSVGETKAIAALAKQFKNRPDKPILIVSSTSETGHAEAQRSLPFADFHVYMPFDLYFIIAPIINRIRPEIVLLSESDYWYNFLRCAKSHGAKIFVVNAKVSQRSADRFKKASFFTKPLFELVDLLCVQNKLYADRFAEKMDVTYEKMVITGNMKFDENYPKLAPEELLRWREQLGVAPDEQVLVAGSTHDPEEKLLLGALKEVWKFVPKLKVLIVPRHPERFQAVATILAGHGVSFIRFSQANRRLGSEKITLIDAMGLLRKCYQLADIALVCGSYTEKVGGHNIIEPCWYSVPVLFGPCMHSQPELVSLVKEYKAGMEVPPEQLGRQIIELLIDPKKRSQLGQGGTKLVTDMKGATGRTFEALTKFIVSKERK